MASASGQQRTDALKKGWATPGLCWLHIVPSQFDCGGLSEASGMSSKQTTPKGSKVS
jgi:hypothetical protein